MVDEFDYEGLYGQFEYEGLSEEDRDELDGMVRPITERVLKGVLPDELGDMDRIDIGRFQLLDLLTDTSAIVVLELAAELRRRGIGKVH